MAGTTKTYTGEDSAIWIASGAIANAATHTTIGIGDFSLTMDKGVVEQELLGESGNYHVAGSLSAEISITSCKLDSNAAPYILGASIIGYDLCISGNAGANSLHFYFVSCAVTGFDISIGDADTVTEGSIDLSVKTPYDISRTLKSEYEGVSLSNA